MHEMFELAFGGREQFFDRPDMTIHRAADIEEQQHLDGVVPFRAHQDVEIALVRAAFDRAVEIELVGGPGTGEFAQAAQRDLDVARAEFDIAGKILEFALVPTP